MESQTTASDDILLTKRHIEVDSDVDITVDYEKSNTGWTKHPELYFPDGTVVLLCDDTLFKVYAGILSVQSEIFRDMFSLTAHQPVEIEKHDGCPLVRLADDKEELAHFLKALLYTEKDSL
ncbi:hypothetical protein M422DRAFT_269564 [Sphaerobolus stellatus SS14]|uniref:BTB domain-containing protein n=1 Tax=Sphaerobolus stellatus (strain SS14) TaxID=990650 RepID=A0A0C9U4F3_SPHS4|nr:hypothetical protein M422DRAFT_269564 [Sphaerobolus stellatus SS14]